MKKMKKLKELKSTKEIPKKFKSEEEEAEFWDTHSFGEIMKDLPISNIVPRKKDNMKVVSIRLKESDLLEIKKISKKVNMNYTVLLRKIVEEGIDLFKKV